MRTTFIVGFPGETDAEFEELADFVARRRVSKRCGVFTYSYEPETPAVKLDGHLDESVKEQRRARLMQAQQEIALTWSTLRSARRSIRDRGRPRPRVCSGHVQARGHADAPDIDCMVRVKAKGLQAGDIASVKISAADGYDLVGRTIGRGQCGTNGVTDAQSRGEHGEAMKEKTSLPRLVRTTADWNLDNLSRPLNSFADSVPSSIDSLCSL